MDLSESNEKEASIVTGPNESYQKGSEVYMSYGRYSNRQLLSTYGFALKENSFNYARVKLTMIDLIIQDSLKEYAKNIQTPYVFKIKSGEICESKNYLELLQTIRGLNWNVNSSPEFFFKPEILEENNEKVLSNNEILFTVVAITCLQKTLESFPTSIEEDLEILDQENTLNKYFAVLYRLQVKKIIFEQIEILKELIQDTKHKKKTHIISRYLSQ